ncbi:hypothetical protein [Haemophilus parainfluenzae]|uniref:Leucine-rich repeat domain-containing protein n=1 Tax=Haemophilus parainfluenzae TaxID=729 RepID=A0A7M1NW34_HAEPA|nr:hypothetical protein [Haemophilus parainfluenzae]QOR17148.1 hypothetical protein INP94_09850 [Haemophilus parainfluenzae]
MSKKIRSCAIYKDLIIESAEDYTVTIRCRDRKTRSMLREISEDLGFEYSDDWNTRYFGHRLINFINGVDTRRETTKLAEDKFPEELITDTTEYISDEDWEWWCGLSDTLKYIVLWNIKDEFLDEDHGLTPEYDDLSEEISTELDLYDRNGAIAFYLKDYIVGVHFSDGNFEPGITHKFVIPDNVFNIRELPKLSHIKQLSSLSFHGWGGGFGSEEIDLLAQIPQLKELDLTTNSVSGDALEKLSSLTNLRTLSVPYSGDWSADECSMLASLGDKLPNCVINLHVGTYEDISNLATLKSLNVSSLSFRDWDESVKEDVIDLIISFSSIKELDLSGNKVDIQLLAKLASLPNLDTLYLEDTKNFDYYSIEPDSDEYHQLQSALPNCKIRYSM